MFFLAHADTPPSLFLIDLFIIIASCSKLTALSNVVKSQYTASCVLISTFSTVANPPQPLITSSFEATFVAIN